MLSVLLSLLGAAVAVSFPWRRLRSLRALAPPERVLGAIRDAAGVPALRDLVTGLPRGQPVEELLRAVTESPSPRIARGAVNERLSTLDAALSRGAEGTVAAVRLSLMMGALTAVMEMIRGLGTRGSVLFAAMAFAVGLAGALATRELGHRADVRARRLRAEYDSIVRALEPWL